VGEGAAAGSRHSGSEYLRSRDQGDALKDHLSGQLIQA
jgi:hypothetical protein